jgi:hypothetical protein
MLTPNTDIGAEPRSPKRGSPFLSRRGYGRDGFTPAAGDVGLANLSSSIGTF